MLYRSGEDIPLAGGVEGYPTARFIFTKVGEVDTAQDEVLELAAGLGAVFLAGFLLV